MKLISVIVPFYKSEQYISKCIQSIIGQTYVNLEIILVNDGSIDKSREICSEFAKKDKRIVILDKVNGGVSSARNYGLEHAHGDYITFVDSDDSIENDLYEKMILNFSDGVDVVCCGIRRLDSYGKLLCEQNMTSGKREYTPAQAMKECLDDSAIGFNVYTKLFRRELFNNPNDVIRFPEGRLMEEANVLPWIFQKCKRLIHIGEAKYNYYIRENSYTSKVLCEECYYIYDTISTYEKVLRQMFPEIDVSLKRWKITNCMYLYRRALLERKFMNKDVYTRIKNEFVQLFKDREDFSVLSIKKKFFLLETITGLYVLRKKILS